MWYDLIWFGEMPDFLCNYTHIHTAMTNSVFYPVRSSIVVFYDYHFLCFLWKYSSLLYPILSYPAPALSDF